MDICFGFKKCLNNREYFIGFMLVILSVYVIIELVVLFLFGFIIILFFLEKFIKF